MGFYEEISKYYDYIFPVSLKTVEFIKGVAGDPPKSILDIACGTGGYSLELEKCGYDLTAVDIDKAMIEGLETKASSSQSKVEYLQAGMLELKEKFLHRMFDTAFCIGNSLVHLDNIDEIKKFFYDVKSILSKDAKLVIQTINFDRVIAKDIKSLPTINDEAVGLSFERYYRYEKALSKVFFKTILTVDGKKTENEIPLTPLKYDETIEMLRSAGFTCINTYGGFDNSPYDKDNSYLMVITAK